MTILLQLVKIDIFWCYPVANDISFSGIVLVFTTAVCSMSLRFLTILYFKEFAVDVVLRYKLSLTYLSY